MSHELSQHVDRRAGVSVPLGVAVPVGVEEHRGLVELGAVRPAAAAPVRRPRRRCAEARGSSEMGRFPQGCGMSWAAAQARSQRGIRETFPDPLLVAGDHSAVASVIASRRPAAVVLEVGVDQRVLAVAVLVEAIPRSWQISAGLRPVSMSSWTATRASRPAEAWRRSRAVMRAARYRIGQCTARAIVVGHRR